MIKIRVQCLPQHIGITKTSLEKNFQIHSTSMNYPNKDSQFVRIYFEATPINQESSIRVETILDIIDEQLDNLEHSKNFMDKSLSADDLLKSMKIMIQNAVDPKYQSTPGGQQ